MVAWAPRQRYDRTSGMCTLAAFVRVIDGLPLVVAANRDEFLARPTAAPALLEQHPPRFGGRDLRAGGSWLVLARSGLVVGLLNRRAATNETGERPSRGRLPVLLAAAADAAEAVEILRVEAAVGYAPFRLLLADRQAAFVAANLDLGLQVERLEPGVHVLTNVAPDEGPCPRLHFCAPRMEALAARQRLLAHGLDGLVGDLRGVLAEHRAGNAGPFERPCIHLPEYGTRSTSIVALRGDARAHWFHAEAAPCRGPLRELDLPWSSAAEAVLTTP